MNKKNGIWEEFSDSIKHFLKKLQVHLSQVQGTKYKRKSLSSATLSSSSCISLFLFILAGTAHYHLFTASILNVSLILFMHTTTCQHFLKYS